VWPGVPHCSNLGRGGVPQEGTGAPEGPVAHEPGWDVRDSVVQEELAFVQKNFVRHAEV